VAYCIDDDTILCNLADPPLSSVEQDTRRIGFEAAVLLDKMMRGYLPTEPRLLIDPLRVVTRPA
jgi:LacI family transcriptional regulator